ncbi:hypothetical protein [Sphingomonas immobilis]|uniref:YdhG-like domain-containing protein n=1 Tax=Sphingomonas immobilis TaxID=3063997 RepID=A0ABT8ZTH0_9SPHN|nr:hypothetical protein [Sphingomonas sp. CA1-15]MDO7840863.1 hypothetical protein [Sphingomonas sp. CA1-15]
MNPQAQLDAMIDRFTPEVAGVARAAVAMVMARLPGATVLVYDNYNALAIAFSASGKASQAVCSVALYPRWASLFLANGPDLADPDGLMEGQGATMRHIKLTPALVDDARVHALLDAAAANVRVPIDPAGEGRLVIQSVSAKQRPRRA